LLLLLFLLLLLLLCRMMIQCSCTCSGLHAPLPQLLPYIWWLYLQQQQQPCLSKGP
jgi:hypothetical protein